MIDSANTATKPILVAPTTVSSKVVAVFTRAIAAASKGSICHDALTSK